MASGSGLHETCSMPKLQKVFLSHFKHLSVPTPTEGLLEDALCLVEFSVGLVALIAVEDVVPHNGTA